MRIVDKIRFFVGFNYKITGFFITANSYCLNASAGRLKNWIFFIFEFSFLHLLEMNKITNYNMEDGEDWKRKNRFLLGCTANI